MAEHRLVLGTIQGGAGVPFGHLPGLGCIEAEAEAVARFPFAAQHARDERLLPALEAHRMHMDIVQINGLSPLRVTRP